METYTRDKAVMHASRADAVGAMEQAVEWFRAIDGTSFMSGVVIRGNSKYGRFSPMAEKQAS